MQNVFGTITIIFLSTFNNPKTEMKDCCAYFILLFFVMFYIFVRYLK